MACLYLNQQDSSLTRFVRLYQDVDLFDDQTESGRLLERQMGEESVLHSTVGWL